MPEITLYSKTPCKPCANLKVWFKIKNIKYTEVELADHIDELISYGFMAAPVVKINSTYVAGSNISDVRSTLEDQGGLNVTSTLANA